MKVKATPADFVVEEVAAAAISEQPAEFAVFQLSKTSWDTFDLVDVLARRWGVPREAIGLGGYKDRHGTTVQRISVRGLQPPTASGTPPAIREKNFRATFLGWSPTPLSAEAIRGNRFRITLRDLTVPEAEAIRAAIPEVARFGLPNYYDAQRFGSARHGQGFMGKEIFLGRREKAVRLYFTSSKHDDRRTRALKGCVLEHWGRWEACAALAFGEYGRVLEVLRQHRGAFHKALARMDRRFLVLVLNAYQSFLFNELLARWLGEKATAAGCPLVPLRSPFGALPFFHSLTPALEGIVKTARLPVPGYDTVCGDEQVSRILEEVLSREGITQADLRVRQMSGIHVGGALRTAVVVPGELSAGPAEPDDRYAGRSKLALSFFLPRGSYATLLLKRLLLAKAR